MLLYILQVVFWVELPVQRRLYPIFVKLWVSVKGAQQCGIELPDIHKLSASWRLVNGPLDFGASQYDVIKQEVKRLLSTGFIREVEYSKWLANVVVVPKKN